jgi:CRP-like cAMP-binding protein
MPPTEQELREIYLFANLTEQQLEFIKQSARQVHLEDGEFLFQHGDPANRFFVVKNGYIKLMRLSFEGAEKVIEVIHPKKSFAEAIMFMSKQTYPVTAQAIGKVDLIAFENKVFLNILENSFDTCLRIMGHMSMRMRSWLDEIDNLTLQNATFRLINYLLGQIPAGTKGEFQLKLGVPKHIIASRLSITPETLSRILKQMNKENLVSVRGKTITIQNIEGLRMYTHGQNL